MVKEDWKLPKRFIITPELIAASDAAQKQWMAAFNTPFSIADGRTRERGLASIKIREYNQIGLINLTKNQLVELAESYAEIGRFDEASEIAKRAKQSLLSAYYLQIWGAVWRADEKWCDCGIEHRYVEKDIWSVKHNEERPLLRCNNNCGCVNVSGLPKEIAAQRAMREQARELTKGMNPRQAKQTLNNRNHTHEKLLGNR